jgi:glutamate racemase
MDPRPIGVFDSGLGGLTVLRVLRERFPNENFVYLGDTARLPYGSKSPETIRRYSLQNLNYLVRCGVKAVVVACNSASTQMSDPQIDQIPIYNTIAPGARAAVEQSPRGRIGLIGTRATVESKAYEKEIHLLAPDAQIFTQACPLLVPLAEEAWDSDPVTNLIVYRYLQTLLQNHIDVLILGCTHYPLLAGSIIRVTGSAVALVDSGEAIAALMKDDLAKGRWKPAPEGRGTLSLKVTDGAPSFAQFSKRILGEVAAEPEWVDLGTEPAR